VVRGVPTTTGSILFIPPDEMLSFSQALQRLSSAMQGAKTCAMNGLDVYHQIKSPLSPVGFELPTTRVRQVGRVA